MDAQKENIDLHSKATVGTKMVTTIRSPFMKRDNNANLSSASSPSNFQKNKLQETEGSSIFKTTTKKNQSMDNDVYIDTGKHNNVYSDNNNDDVMEEEGLGAVIKSSSPIEMTSKNRELDTNNISLSSPHDQHNNNDSLTKRGLTKRQSHLRKFIQEQREKSLEVGNNRNSNSPERNNSESEVKKNHEGDDSDFSKYTPSSSVEGDCDIGSFDQSTHQSKRDSQHNSPPNLTDNKTVYVQTDYQRDSTSGSPQSQQGLPILQIGNFQESLFLDYGHDTHNTEGKSRSLSFVLQAPPSKSKSTSTYDDDDYHILQVEKVPKKKGFTLTRSGKSDREGTGTSTDRVTMKKQATSKTSLKDPFYIKAGEQEVMTLTWTPLSPGKMRETIYLKMQLGRIRIIAHGAAKKRPIRKKVRIATTLKESKGNLVNSSQPQTKPVKLMNSNPRAAIRRNSSQTKYKKKGPLQPWMKNCDGKLADKQCEAFTTWLNFILKPHEDNMQQCSKTWKHCTRSCDGGDESRGSNSDRMNSGPTLKYLLMERRRVQVSQKAITFYHGSEMKRIKKALEQEIFLNRLSMRSDHDALSNVNLRSQMISLLMSYSTPWLKLGLETLFREPITLDMVHEGRKKDLEVRKSLGIASPMTRKPTMNTALKNFVTTRVLSDPTLLMKYTHGKCKMPSGNFEKKYKEELRQITLLRIMLLVVFLDKAKINNIIDSTPRLFKKNAMIKSSKEFFAILNRDYLHGIGSVFKHLSLIGISVSHEQTCIDELEFSISNLATDLRDGVVIGKLAECLSGININSILTDMRLPAVSRLQKVHNVRIALSSLSSLDIEDLESVQPNHIVDGHRPQVLRLLWSIISSFTLLSLLDLRRLRKEIHNVWCATKVICDDRMKSINAKQIDSCNDVCELLLYWCQAVCSYYDHDVKNFSSCFADGKTLCFLIHFYHPIMINLNDILPTVADTSGLGDQEVQKYILNERKNSELASRCIIDIGGIPTMFPSTDSSNIPDTRSTITFVSYLCSRLLDSSHEILAAITVQKTFRTYQNKKLEEKQCNIHTNAVFLQGGNEADKDEMFGSTILRTQENKPQEAKTTQSDKSSTEKTFGNMPTEPNHSTEKLSQNEEDLEADSEQNRCKETIENLTFEFNHSTEDLSQNEEDSESDCEQINCKETIENLSIESNHSAKERSQNGEESEADCTQNSCKENIENLSIHSKHSTEDLSQHKEDLKSDCEQINCVETIENMAIESNDSVEERSQNEEDSESDCEQSSCKETVQNLAVESNHSTEDLSQNEEDSESDCKQISCKETIENLSTDSIHSTEDLSQNGEDSESDCEQNNCKETIENLSESEADCKQNSCKETESKHDSLTQEKSAKKTIEEGSHGNNNVFNESLNQINITEKEIADNVDLVLYKTVTEITSNTKQGGDEEKATALLLSIEKINSTTRRAMEDRKNTEEELAKMKAATLKKRRELEKEKEELTKIQALADAKKQKIMEEVMTETKRIEMEEIAKIKAAAEAYKLEMDMELAQIKAHTKARKKETEREEKELKNVKAATVTKRRELALETMYKERHTERKNKEVKESVIKPALVGPRREIREFTKDSKKFPNGKISASKNNDLMEVNKNQNVTENQKTVEINAVAVELSTSRSSRSSSLKKERRTRNDVISNTSKDTIKMRYEKGKRKLEIDSVAIDKIRIAKSKNEEVIPLNNTTSTSSYFGEKALTLKPTEDQYFVGGKKQQLNVDANKTKQVKHKLYREQKVEVNGKESFRKDIKRTTKKTENEIYEPQCKISNVGIESYPKSSAVVLDNETSDALQVLQTSRQFTQIAQAVRRLEMSSSISYQCCEALASTGAAKILYKFIRLCNRSSPHLELLQHILTTLSNISKIFELISKIITADCVEVLLDLLQMFRDKDIILSLTSTLLRRIVYSDAKMAEQCKRSENFRRMRGCYSLTIQELNNNKIQNKSSSKEKKLAAKALKKLLQKIKD